MLLLATVLASGTKKIKAAALKSKCLVLPAEPRWAALGSSWCSGSKGKYGEHLLSPISIKNPHQPTQEGKEKEDGKQAKKKIQKNKYKQKTHAKTEVFGPLIKTTLITASILRSALF